ncbi:hypothetical protein IVB03_37995 [Bradyrhizobium sp. 168]|nr:hypothetical protein [Bradyrhizobium sp. 168]
MAIPQNVKPASIGLRLSAYRHLAQRIDEPCGNLWRLPRITCHGPNYAQRIKPIDPEKFSFALGAYQAAAALKGPAPNPAQYSANLVDEDGSCTKISFVDGPENRGMLAVKEQFPDPNEFESMVFRILSFGEVLQDQKLSEMGVVKRQENVDLEVHDSVIDALATTSITVAFLI